MPAETVSTRCVREILRYRFEQRLGYRAISLRVGAVPLTVRETLKRAAAAGLTWPLGDDVSDAALEAALYREGATRRGTVAVRSLTGLDPIVRCSANT